MQLSGHADDHVVEIGVEVFALGHVQSFGRQVMVTSEHVVDVVESSGSEPDLGEIGGPHASVGIFGFFLGIVGRVDSVVNQSVSVFPFLVIVLFEVVVGRVDGIEADDTLDIKRLRRVRVGSRPYQE